MSYGPRYPSSQFENELSVCPSRLASYASQNLDSIGKITNHVLAISLICNLFLFFSSLGVVGVPNLGINATMITWLLILQNVFVFLVLNNSIAPRFLKATPVMMGVAIGVTIGAAVLALIVSSAYRLVARCWLISGSSEPWHNTTYSIAKNHMDSKTHGSSEFGDPVYEYNCQQHVGTMTAIWFWSGLVFWFNFCTCLLLTVGQQEWTHLGRNQYEHIGNSIPESAVSQDPYGRPPSSTTATPFAGDYSTIPEVRNGSSVDPSSINARSHVSSGAQVLSV